MLSKLRASFRLHYISNTLVTDERSQQMLFGLNNRLRVKLVTICVPSFADYNQIPFQLILLDARALNNNDVAPRLANHSRADDAAG